MGNTASIIFSGAKLILNFTQNMNRGNFDVDVGGNKIATINAIGTLQWQRNITGLVYTTGTHEVQIKHVGGGTIIDVEAVEIY